VTTRARRVDVTEDGATLSPSNYASAFEVSASGGDGRSPEQWARAAFEGAPRAMQWFILAGWRSVMWFRLGPRPSPDHVMGWAIVARAPDAITLEVRSALATARKVVRVDASRVVMTTFVRFEWWAGKAIWSAIAPVHHRTEPYLLGHAASELQAPER
jgi:hypothetical protein